VASERQRTQFIATWKLISGILNSHPFLIRFPQHLPVRIEEAMATKLFSLACTALFLCSSAYAQDETNAPVFSFDGFGTVGVAHSSEEKADFLANDLQGRGAGRGRSWSPDVDSRIGGQLSARFTSQLSAVLQVVSEQRYDTSYRPQVEWGNIKYAFTPDLSVRVGRIVTPVFLESDSRKVGYAQPWVRPPVEVYSLVPLTNNDGADVSYRLRIGETNHNLQVAYGSTSADTPDGGKIKAKDAWLIGDTMEYGSMTLHAAYSHAKFSASNFAPLFDGYRQFAGSAADTAQNPLVQLGFPAAVPALTQSAAQANALADRYDPDNTTISFLSFGAMYDPGDWFLMAEWGQTDSRSVFGKRQAWYATGGYRWGKFTPYITYAEARLKSPQNDAGITAVPGGAPFNDLSDSAALLNANLNEQLAGAPIQKTISIGVRWDLARNTAFKLQYDYSRIGDGSPGTLDHQSSGFVPGGNFSVVSATLDFVF
jgi:opacity protein-like surface antigen